MGTICAHPNEKDECNETVDTTKKNSVQAQGTLGPNGFVDLVLGIHLIKEDTTATSEEKAYSWSSKGNTWISATPSNNTPTK